MSCCNRTLTVGLVLASALPTSDLYGAQNGPDDTAGKNPAVRIGVEYLYPKENSRDISTINVNAYYLVAEIEAADISLYAGLTATYASGDITQLEGDINQGTLREVTYENEAAGIGPGVLVDFRLLGKDRISLHLDASGHLLFYSDDFPAGGDRYNFMWRGGPSLKFPVGINRKIDLGYQWMHVSNGRGLGPENPSYDAEGLTLAYTVTF